MHWIVSCFMLVVLAAGCGDAKPAEPLSSSGENVAASPAASPTVDDRPIILAFGDSLTAGSGLAPGSVYPEMLQRELDESKYGYRVVNAGVGGDTTGGGLARIQM